MYIIQVFQDWFLVLEKLIMHLYIDSRKWVIPMNNILQEILKILVVFSHEAFREDFSDVSAAVDG